MSLPEKLLEKAFYWGPLFVGVVCLIVGVIFVRSIYNYDGEIPLAKLQLPTPQKQVPLEGGEKLARIVNQKKSDISQTTENRSSLKQPDLSRQKNSQQVEKSLAETTPLIRKPTPKEDTKSSLEQKVKEEQIVRITIPQLVGLQSTLLGDNADFAIAGFNRSVLRSSILGVEFSGSNLAYWGKVSQFGLQRAINRSGHVSVIAGASLLGVEGQDFIAGLNYAHKRSFKPLIAYYSERMGAQFLPSQKGFQKSLVAGALVQRQFIVSQGHDFGVVPQIAADGLSQTTVGSQKLLKVHQLSQVSEKIGQQASLRNLKGIKRAVTSAEKMKVAAIALAAPGGFPLNRKEGGSGELKNLPCSERFYAALQDIRSSKISSIRTAARPISTIDKTLPGKWIFTPPSFRTRSVCTKYRYKRSGKRRCVKWSKSRPTNTSYTDDERDYILAAQKLIKGKGRHPMVKPRSPSHWVINIVAQNLNSYSSQKSHPALCTGALGMLDYFEGNLNRFKKHMLEIASLNEQSKAHILNQVERLNASLNNQSPIDTLNNDETSFTQNQRIVISSYDPVTVNGQAIAALFGEDVGLEVLSRHNFIEAMSLTRALLNSRKQQIHSSTYNAILRLATILEASYYIQKSNEKYNQLEQKLFGSLRGIRTAHFNHCNCSN